MGEAISSWIVDGVFTGGSPTHHVNQMKLFNLIDSSAAVITSCLGNPIPAEASLVLNVSHRMANSLAK